MAKKKIATRRIPKTCPKNCPKCKSDLRSSDAAYRSYTVTGYVEDGEFKTSSSLDWDGATKCSNCDIVVAHL